jgi:hypothetical protein
LGLVLLLLVHPILKRTRFERSNSLVLLLACAMLMCVAFASFVMESHPLKDGDDVGLAKLVPAFTRASQIS